MKFITDHMLGKLAKELRMLGYDTLYYRGENGYPLIKLARDEGRVILTRSSKLAPRRPEDRIIRITADKPSSQVRELIQAGAIHIREEIFFSRCLQCNVPIHEIPREEAEGKVPDFILYQQKEFFQCPACSKIYWRGSHQDHMKKRIEQLRQPNKHPITGAE